MPTLDPILVIGILTSVGLSVLLVLTGLDRAQGLLLGLLGTILTLLIDLIARLRETEGHVLEAFSHEMSLMKDKWLSNIVKQIVADHKRIEAIGMSLFPERAVSALEECRDVLHGLAEGYMVVEPKGRHSFGPAGIKMAKHSVRAVSYAAPEVYWGQVWAEPYFQANKKAVERGVEVVRIFLAEKSHLLALREVMKRQADAGIEVLVIVLDEVPIELREDYLVQDDQVLVRLELTQEGLAKGERISIRPVEVREALSRFERLSRASISLDEFISLVSN